MMRRRSSSRSRLVVALGSTLGLAGCSNEEIPMPEVQPLTREEWNAAAEQHVVFGHQSVGGNILEGVRALAAELDVEFRIAESRSGTDGVNVAHFKIGRNEEPLLKIEDFSNAVEAGAIRGMDLAMMKLCYIDFTAQTDARALAGRYIAAVERLQTDHPETAFVAVTAPLTTLQGGPKAWVKRLLGRAPAGYEENLRRTEFNEQVRARFAGSGRLFDLASVESQGAGFEYRGSRVESLNPGMTTDGGHLNEEGRRRVATAFIRFLAGASPSDD